MNYLFLDKKSKRKISAAVTLLQDLDSPECAKLKAKLATLESEFVTKAKIKHPDLIERFKSFLKKTKSRLIGESEKSEKDLNLGVLENEINNL